MNSRDLLEPEAARARGLLARRAMGAPARDAASSVIHSRLTGLADFAAAATVAGYWSSTDEVDLGPLWEQLASSGVAVHLPRIDPGGAPTMEFVSWDPEVAMSANRYGIAEPPGTGVPPDHLDVVVMPCTAIDDAGTRVGMGAGFYDRALANARAPGGSGAGGAPLLIAVAFECQRVPAAQRIVRREWDVGADVVVTESALLRPQGTR